MELIKAFGHIGPLADNVDGVIAPIGEISMLSLTFTREKSTHVHQDFASETLIGFDYEHDGVKGVMPNNLAYQCLKAVNWIYVQARLGRFNESKDSFQQAFIGSLGTEYDLIDSGAMVAFSTYYAPEYITIAPANGSENNNWQIWLSDEAFSRQYNLFTILVVPPFEGVDQFFGDAASVAALISDVTMSETMQRVNTLKGAHPPTLIRTEPFEWRDRLDDTMRIKTEWTTIIYGNAGNNYDAIKEALRESILANSTHTREEWKEIFPEIFTATEFIFTPMWDNYAIPNEVRSTGVYSAVTRFKDALAQAVALCRGIGYDEPHIADKLEVFPTLYKSLSVPVTAGFENPEEYDLFSKRFPDLINAPSTHVDYVAMAKYTRDFLAIFHKLLMAAEEMTASSAVPQGVIRVTREGIVYATATYDRYLYLVATKAGTEAIPEEEF